VVSLQPDISLSITESAAGGYDFGVLIGDPPPAGEAAAHHSMVAAISSFGANSDASGSLTSTQHNDHDLTLTRSA
jgi:hypothetical protein